MKKEQQEHLHTLEKITVEMADVYTILALIGMADEQIDLADTKYNYKASAEKRFDNIRRLLWVIEELVTRINTNVMNITGNEV